MRRTTVATLFVVLVAGKLKADYLLWTDNVDFGARPGDIRRASLDGLGQKTLLQGLESPNQIAADPFGGKMYWAEGDSAANDIRRANLNGSSSQVLLRSQFGAIGMALDPAAGQMYWIAHKFSAPVNGFDGKDIRRANFNGTNEKTLVDTGNIEGNGQLALDLAGGKIYTTDYNEGTIRRFNLDGSGGQTLSDQANGPIGIALDVPHGTMYWADNGSASIMQANLDGSGVKVVLDNLVSPCGLTLDLDAGKMYWTNYADHGVPDGEIHVANLDGSDPQTLVKGLNGPFSITIVPLVGDANRDGKVDFADLLVLAQHYGTPSGATRADGDFNGDGKVNFDDLLILAQHYGTSDAVASSVPVPEPAWHAMIVAVSVCLCRRRSRCAPLPPY